MKSLQAPTLQYINLRLDTQLLCLVEPTNEVQITTHLRQPQTAQSQGTFQQMQHSNVSSVATPSTQHCQKITQVNC